MFEAETGNDGAGDGQHAVAEGRKREHAEEKQESGGGAVPFESAANRARKPQCGGGYDDSGDAKRPLNAGVRWRGPLLLDSADQGSRSHGAMIQQSAPGGE